VVIEKTSFRVTHNLTQAGDEILTAKGEMTIANLSPAIDPVANGFRLRVLDQGGAVIFLRDVPPGPPLAPGLPGWTTNALTTRFKFKDRAGGLAGGVTKVKLSATTAGRFKFKLIGKGNFLIQPGQEPVRVEIILGGDAQRAADQCGTVAFSAEQCSFYSLGTSFSCR
jgi:hypothetical protein